MSVPSPLVEYAGEDAFARWPAAMRSLDARAAEPNPFSETAFLAPALAHLPERRRARLLLIWSDARRDRLIGRLAVATPKLGVGPLRVWRSEQAPFAALTLDREALDDALAALLLWLRARGPLRSSLILPRVAVDGPIDRALARAGARAGLAIYPLHGLRRAALRLGNGGTFETPENRKRGKTWDRYERRLAESGALDFRASDDPAAAERFLALEAKGWKGARGTALIQSPARAAFARAMLAGFRREGRLRIHELALGEASIAAGVQLRSEGAAFFWKIAHDEAFSAQSPGVLLTRALSRRLEREAEVSLVDSCASGEMATVDRLWPDRLDFEDRLAAPPGPAGAALAALERARPRWRARVKAVVLPLIGRK